MNTIRLGSSGPDVVAWQKVLGVTADGAFGPATEKATQAWQIAHGLPPDGVVGPMTWAKTLAPHPDAPMLHGLDGSSVQGILPFDQLVATGIKFVILKAQQGNDGFDPDCIKNAEAAIAHGLTVFAYCFLYPLPHLDPREQARLFLSKLKGTVLEGKPIFVDCEWPEPLALKAGGKGWKEWGCTPAQISQWMKDCCDELSKSTTVVMYTYDDWWSCVRDGRAAYGFPQGADVSWAAQYALWMAWYRKGWPVGGDAPRIPKPWTKWLFWQFDGNGGLVLPNGLDADFSVFNGDEQALADFAARARPADVWASA